MSEVIPVIGKTFDFVDITDRGLNVKSDDVSWDQMEALWNTVTSMHSISQWAIGDAYNLAAKLFLEDASQLVNPRGGSYKSIQNYAWVCRRFFDDKAKTWEKATRWRYPVNELSFSHHAAVAGLMEDEAERKFALDLLKKAVKENMSVAEVEAEVRKFRGEEESPAEREEVSFSKGPPLARLERLKAGCSGLLEDWPDEWDVERRMIENAERELGGAFNSVNNRAAGGDAALEAEDVDAVAA